MCWGPEVVHAFNPSTWDAEANRFLSSRPAWSTKWIPRQPDYTEKPCLKKPKPKPKKRKQKEQKQKQQNQNKPFWFTPFPPYSHILSFAHFCWFCGTKYNQGCLFLSSLGSWTYLWTLCVSLIGLTQDINQAGLKLRNHSASASQVLGLKACATTARLSAFIIYSFP